MSKRFDIAVTGGGLAGSVAALAAAARGWTVAFVAPPPPAHDGRTTALLSESIALLDELGVWNGIAARSAPLRTMRILDGTGRLFRAPPVAFRCEEIGLDCFGYNIPNQPLHDTLQARIADTVHITRFGSPLASALTTADGIDVTLADGTPLSAEMVLAADGRNSTTREAAGISVRAWTYDQTAIVLTFAHRLPHNDISTEFHTETGPFTQVPLPGNRSSLVWAVAPGHVDGIMALPADELNRRIEARMASILGAVTVDSPLQSYPMSGQIARAFGSGRTMLVGETGHAFPPIGAQGLNLGLRDITQAIAAVVDAGGPSRATEAVSAFDRARRLDVGSRTAGVDMLNRVLLTSFLPVQMLRSGGLAVLGAVGPLRLLAMREGMTPGWRSARPAEPSSARKQIGGQGPRGDQP
ncbi:2-octaprenyl-3-methyl-6-methoxy-1,4-benzoquinol hydroxylase [Hoeflea marina]|uniref:2-octaprenyl-3-methyl-6-methoxy-1,4-benzoquinol hydroxylase n=1 Tax=Hoeflea marina TaxID=274592 RepID=A0A317PTR8_9HYPH|nr:UbiH/UbiF family hydroxylase [Hoeflea marina]PWW04105.1 2-octaprenyl-3-methyl-6-methoxy-1,4-benzoquinol hydroxylase [Hoeflea marina]